MMAARASRASRAPAVGFIFVTMVLDWLVVGMISPVVPKLVVDLTGNIARASAIAGAFATELRHSVGRAATAFSS